MHRRDALRTLGLLSGGMVLSAAGLLNACTSRQKNRADLSASDVLLLDAIGETIIPASPSLPGAKAAAIGTYMLVMVNDCYSREDKARFLKGLDALELACKQKYGSIFLALHPEQKKEFLTQLDSDLTAAPDHYFGMLKKLSINGYFSSEIGATKALRYQAVPGTYQIIAYAKGDKRWAMP